MLRLRSCETAFQKYLPRLQAFAIRREQYSSLPHPPKDPASLGLFRRWSAQRLLCLFSQTLLVSPIKGLCGNKINGHMGPDVPQNSPGMQARVYRRPRKGVTLAYATGDPTIGPNIIESLITVYTASLRSGVHAVWLPPIKLKPLSPGQLSALYPK